VKLCIPVSYLNYLSEALVSQSISIIGGAVSRENAIEGSSLAISILDTPFYGVPANKYGGLLTFTINSPPTSAGILPSWIADLHIELNP